MQLLLETAHDGTELTMWLLNTVRHLFSLNNLLAFPNWVTWLVVLPLAMASVASGESRDVWVGTSADGIYHVSIDLSDGALSKVTRAAELQSPGFLAQHPKSDRLYAVCRVDGQPSVAGFTLERSTDSTTLRPLNSRPIEAGNGTHLCIDRSGTMLITAQYGAGTVAVFPLDDVGRIGARSQLIEHQGGSRAYEQRQDSPHPHWVGVDPQNQFAFVPDLGLDQVVVYRIVDGRLQPHDQLQLPPGSGPRHMKFTHDGKHAYVLNELSLTVGHCTYDANAGKLELVEVVPALTDEEKAGEVFNSASEIRIHPTQQFVYTANRGHDTITVFSRDVVSGKLVRNELEPIRGSWPRNFNLTSDGNWLIAAGKESNTLTVFSVDKETGKLQYIRQSVNVPQPICVLPSEPF